MTIAERKSLKILFAAAETVPLAKVGGLADVIGALPSALTGLSDKDLRGYALDIRLCLPFHAVIPPDLPGLEFVAEFSVPNPFRQVKAQAYRVVSNSIPVYLISGGPIPKQGPIYAMDSQKDGEKFTFFSLALLELCVAIQWQPDILHAHDWHTAVAVHTLANRRSADPFFSNTRSMYTVHNLPYMGAGTDLALSSYGIPESTDSRLPPWGKYQPMPMGLASADLITAVSPTYSREIMTPEFGCGLEGFLQARSTDITGVLNGLDIQNYDPSTDPAISVFNRDMLERRGENKRSLQLQFSLEVDPLVPLIVLISRFDHQKGIDLAIGALEQIRFDCPWQAILLGNGSPEIENAACQLQESLPDRVRAVISFDSRLARRMYAGGDLLLAPSRYEPCGLTQMIAMRYGCIPVARATGGFCDTIIDEYDPTVGNGFLFGDTDADACADAIRRALYAFTQPSSWQVRQHTAMSQDFSWDRSARTYLDLYFKILNR